MKLFASTRSSVWILLFLLGWLPGPKTEAEMISGMQHYTISAKASHFFVFTGTAGLFGGLGHKHKIAVPGLSGEMNFDPAQPSKASLTLSIQSISLYLVVEDKKEEGDKEKIEENMRTKVLEATTYPTIDFRSREIAVTPAGTSEFNATIKGDLTLHGATRVVSIPAKVNLGENRISAQGEFTLKQTDYGIKPFSAGGGTVKVKDEVRLSFEIIAQP